MRDLTIDRLVKTTPQSTLFSLAYLVFSLDSNFRVIRGIYSQRVRKARTTKMKVQNLTLNWE